MIGDPIVELRWPAFPHDEHLLAIVGCSLQDQLLDQIMILCDPLHCFWRATYLELLAPLVDQFKYPPWAGLSTQDQEVFLAPVGCEARVERTLHFADP